MDENKVIRPMDFVRLTNIDELNVIKDTKNHIGLVKEVSRDGSGWVISFTLSFGLEGGTQIRFDKEDEYLSEIDRLNELFNVIL